MGRKPKHPEHKRQAEELMNELLDGVVAIWISEKEPQLNTVSEELEMSTAKVRKLLITAGVRDGERYYENAVADRVLRLWREKKSVAEISVETGLSKSSVTGYLPHSKIIYSLDTLSTEAERVISVNTILKGLMDDQVKPPGFDACEEPSRSVTIRRWDSATSTRWGRSSAARSAVPSSTRGR